MDDPPEDAQKVRNWKGNDREPIQSNSKSCPRHQTGKEHKHLGVEQHKQRAKRTALSQQMATKLS